MRLPRLLAIPAAAGSALVLAACAEEPLPLAPPGPPPMVEPAGPAEFNPGDFAWSTQGGTASIIGILAFGGGAARYVCNDVILTPDTPWTRRRMMVLYGSANAADVPTDIVQARTASAPSADYRRFAKKTSCDGANRFEFDGLPPGGWYVITLAKPVGGGGSVAVMRRVDTRAGERSITLN